MKLPQAFVNASAPKAEVNARIDMSAEVAGEGKCPECRQPMQEVFLTAEVASMACKACRITLPLKNGD